MPEKTFLGLPIWITIFLPIIWLVVNTCMHYLREGKFPWFSVGRDLHLNSFSMSLAAYLMPDGIIHNPGTFAWFPVYLFLNLVFLSVTAMAYVTKREDWCFLMGVSLTCISAYLIWDTILFSV